MGFKILTIPAFEEFSRDKPLRVFIYSFQFFDLTVEISKTDFFEQLKNLHPTPDHDITIRCAEHDETVIVYIIDETPIPKTVSQC